MYRLLAIRSSPANPRKISILFAGKGFLTSHLLGGVGRRLDIFVVSGKNGSVVGKRYVDKVTGVRSICLRVLYMLCALVLVVNLGILCTLWAEGVVLIIHTGVCK